MMRWAATLLSALIVIFSLTFIVTRRNAAGAATQAPQLVATPIAAGPTLRVRTLRGAAPLPRLRRSGAAAAAPSAPGAPAAPPPPPPVGSSVTPPKVLCARAAWAQLTGGAPALPQTGRC